MPTYRMTVRYGAPRVRYHMEDIEAPTLADALRKGAAALPAEAVDGELVEIRRGPDPERREYAPA